MKIRGLINPWSILRIVFVILGASGVLVAAVYGKLQDNQNLALALLGAGVLLMYLGYSGQFVRKFGIGKDGMTAELAAGMTEALKADDPKERLEAAAELGLATLQAGSYDPKLAIAAAQAVDRRERAIDYETALESVLEEICTNEGARKEKSDTGFDFKIVLAPRVLHIEAKWSLDRPDVARVKTWLPANISSEDKFLLVTNQNPTWHPTANPLFEDDLILVWREGDDEEKLKNKIVALLKS